MPEQDELADNKKSVFKEWLEKLQQESWQLELLISGLALFGIWESRSLIFKFEYYLSNNTVDPYIFYSRVFIFVLWSGWAIFLINLLAHIIIRGLWIGAIGLRYVSGDIDFDDLNYSKIFTTYFKRRIGSFDDYIERLEKLSSVLFSFTFLLFFLLFSFVFINLVFGIIISIASNIFFQDHNGPHPFALTFGGIFYGLGFLVLIDFLSIGGFKKVKDPTFSKIYFWIYRFYSTLSLSFIYRPLLFNFIDNKYTKRLFYLAFPYVLVLLIGFRFLSFERYAFIPSFEGDSRYFNLVDKFAVNWNNYDDLRNDYHKTFSDEERPIEKTRIGIASLDRYEFTESYAKLFLKYLVDDSKLISRQHSEISAFNKPGLRHSIFSNGKIQDPQLNDLIESQTEEIRLMLNVVRKKEDAIDSLSYNKFKDLITEYQSYTIDEIQELREKIIKKHEKLRRGYVENKMKYTINAILANYKIVIDSTNFTDSLQCSFFVHPNMHEQGLLCFVPLNSLQDGPHMLLVEKRHDDGNCTNDCPILEKYLPFRKI